METLNDLLTATREGRLTWRLNRYRTTDGLARTEYAGVYEDGGIPIGVCVRSARPWMIGDRCGPGVYLGKEGRYIWTSRLSKAGQIVTEIYNTAAKQVARQEAERGVG